MSIHPWLRPMVGLVVAASVCLVPSTTFAQEGGLKLNFYPSLVLKFGEGKDNYFLSRVVIVNTSGKPLTDLTIRQAFPKKFKPSLLSTEQREMLNRPEGFVENLQGREYAVQLPELRIAEAIHLSVVLTYSGRPAEVTFPGVEAGFSLDGAATKQTDTDHTWDLSKYTKYAGTIREFVKRYAKMDMAIPTDQGWGFSDLSERVRGRTPLGPVEVMVSRTNRMRYSLEAGTAGDLKFIHVVRQPAKVGGELTANDEVRRFVMNIVRAASDFTLDADEMVVRQGKIGRYDAWIAETRWYDRVKDRLGEGPSRWYVISDDESEDRFVIHIAAQGRGFGPGKADVPNESQEEKLMSELEGIVASLRLL